MYVFGLSAHRNSEHSNYRTVGPKKPKGEFLNHRTLALQILRAKECSDQRVFALKNLRTRGMAPSQVCLHEMYCS